MKHSAREGAAEAMSDRDLADRLGEAIRQALTWEHLPKGRAPGEILQPGALLCECGNGHNLCRDRILEEAFRLYAKEHPERFW
jgi:hypothetical protein